MKKVYVRYGLLFVLIVCLFAFPISCGPGGGGGGEEGAAEEGTGGGEEQGAEEEVEEPGVAAGIRFISAEPNIIAIKGSGGDQISEVTFMVIDTYDNPFQGETVTFAMSGPTGATISPTSDVTNASGIATVWLYSGESAGPVTISATIDLPMTVNSTAVSIGGGVPSDHRFSVAATKLNLPGLEWNGKETEVTAWLADRFGSYNILTGTSVSFGTEVGLATNAASATLQNDGLATVTVRTQAGAGGAHAEDVLPEAWEIDLQTYLAAAYGYTGTTAHPRDGLCTVLVYTKGEEHFNDADSDGVFDAGEFNIADDTPEDPFYDYNDNEDYDGPASLDPEELYIDSAPANGIWDGGDGDWSPDTYIFRNFKILVTGKPEPLGVYNFGDVANGGSREIRFLVCDQNFNQLVAGSSVTISTNVGELSGVVDRDYDESNQVGPDRDKHLDLIEYVVTISDNDPTNGLPGDGEITVQIVWRPEGEAEDTTTYHLPITVN
jgi:hypothetical protein